jgi:inosine-uridine nucleoside N-ribohydrolase
MKRKAILFLSMIIVFVNIGFAHPWKPDHFVIIDTDCGFDDFRALNMLLASSSVRVLAIITSNGVLTASQGYEKVNNMLQGYHHNGILLAMNQMKTSFRNDCIHANNFNWGQGHKLPGKMAGHIETIREVLKNSREKITFINLGNLNTFTSAIAEIPELKNRLTRTLWACNQQNIKTCFNYTSDPNAFETAKKQSIVIEYIDGSIPKYSYNGLLQEDIGSSGIYAKHFFRSLNQNASPFAKACYDETLVLYLHKPELFETNKPDNHSVQVYAKASSNSKEINMLFKQILEGQTSNQNQVFSRFPLDTAYYTDEIQEIMPYCIENYGRTEWVSCVLANEMHRHLGIYAVIGTKMGIRAREYFGAGVDEIFVISHAGLTPPFSCMNDGLQISTGATIGHGTIRLEADSLKLPKADFIYMNRKITLKLKDEYRKRVESEIRNLVALYGLDNNLYWDLVRKNAIDYWKYWSRHEIFDIEVH